MSLEKKYSTHCRAISMFLAAAITIGMVPTMTAPANAFDVNYTDDAVVIKKVDAFTGEPLKGAVFRFEGQTERVIEIPSYIEVETVVPDDPIPTPTPTPTPAPTPAPSGCVIPFSRPRTAAADPDAAASHSDLSPDEDNYITYTDTNNKTHKFRKFKIPSRIMDEYGGNSGKGTKLGESSIDVETAKKKLCNMLVYPDSEFVAWSQVTSDQIRYFDDKLGCLIRTLYRFAGLGGKEPILDDITLYLIDQLSIIPLEDRYNVERVYKDSLEMEGNLGTVFRGTGAVEATRGDGHKFHTGDSGVPKNVFFIPQTDKEYGCLGYTHPSHPNATLKSAGCGPASMAMLLSAFWGIEVDLYELTEWSKAHGYRTNNGTDINFFDGFASDESNYNRIKVTRTGNKKLSFKYTTSQSDAISAINNGGMAIVCCGPGSITKGGHYLLLSGYVDGGFIMQDPYEDHTYGDSAIIRDYLGSGNKEISWIPANHLVSPGGAQYYLTCNVNFNDYDFFEGVSDTTDSAIMLKDDWLGPLAYVGSESSPSTSPGSGSGAATGDNGGTATGSLSGSTTTTVVQGAPKTVTIRQYVSSDWITDKNGEIRMNWWDIDSKNYFFPGTYTVTEIRPPEGYEITKSEARHISLMYDGDTTASQTGPFTYKDEPKKQIVINKVGEDGTAIDGAVFEIYKDANLITTVVTDPSGKAVVLGENGTGLSSGTYRIKETFVPGGYILSDNDIEVHIDNADSSTWSQEIMLKNYKYPDVEIKKVENGTDKGLPGATFRITVDGQTVGTKSTDGDGYIKITYDEYGHFLNENNETHDVLVEELTPPDGYFMDEPVYQQVTMIEGQKLATLMFSDTPYPSIRIMKKVNGTDDGLEGAIFRVTIDGSPFETRATNKDGEIEIKYDEYRRFLNEDNKTHAVRVEEIVAPDGYLIDEPNWQEQVIQYGQSLSVFTFTDTKYPEIHITKTDRETGELLPNTDFKVEIDGTDIGTFTTDEKGQITIKYDDSADGVKGYRHFLNEKNTGDWTVTVTEVKAPDKYNLDDQPSGEGAAITHKLQFGQSLSNFEFSDTHYRDIKVIKKDEQTKELLKGAVFNLKSLDGRVERFGTTDENGEFTFKDLPNGTYELVETAPPFGYDADGHWGDIERSGARTIIVSSDDNRLTTFEYYNSPHSGLLIRKIDATTKQPIPNVRFLINPLAPLTTPAWEAVTDDNGEIVVENIPAGSYQIKEVETVDGYILSDEIQTIEVEDQHDAYTVTFENHQTNMLNVLKLDSQTNAPLAGAKFQVTLNDGTLVGEITTGIYGYANLTNLKPGSYIVKEVQPPAGHIIDPNPQPFIVRETDSGTVYTLVFNNSPLANLFIRKYDEMTGIPLAGVTFRIWESSGKEKTAKTDDQGFIHISNLKADTYFVQEVESLPGYTKNDEIFTVKLEDGQTRTINVPNKKPGGLSVRKIDAATGEPLAGAEFRLAAINGKVIGTQKTGTDGFARWGEIQPGWYTLTETKAPAGYAINDTPMSIEVKDFNSTDIEWPNTQMAAITVVKKDRDTNMPLAEAVFEVRTADNELAATIRTDASGVAVTKQLPQGRYKIKETAAPTGYVLSDKEYEVELKDEPVRIEIPNTAKQNILIQKVDGITRKPLAGAQFELKDVNGRVLEIYETDASGVAGTKSLEPGIYTVVERKAPDGYVLDASPHEIKVEDGSQAVVTMENFAESVIQIRKVDAVSGDPLQDAEFEVRDSVGDIIEHVTTDKTGYAHTQSLPYGKYVIVETKAPVGYSIDPTEHEIKLDKGANTILRLTNSPSTALHISKVDKETRKGLAGAEFELSFDTGSGDCTYIGTYTTDQQGMIHTEPLTPGFYMLKETKAPEGYAILEEDIRYCVKSGEYNQVVVENIALSNLIARKLDEQTGEPIQGAKIKVENADGSDLIGEKMTDANGEAMWPGLTAGVYLVTDMANPDDVRTVEVAYGKTAYVEFKGNKDGSLKIVLQDKKTDEYLAGGEFIVIRESDQNVVFTDSTDKTGTLLTGVLEPGWYTVTQSSSPEKYTMLETKAKVEIRAGEQQTVYFKNISAGLVIEKVDAEHPAIMLEGARFQLKREPDGIVVGEYDTGKDGLAIVDGLKDGLYSITEIVAPEGYTLNTTPQTIEIKAGEVAHATFMDYKPSGILIRVSSGGRPIAGTKLEVREQNGGLVDTFTTDATGTVQTGRLPAGHYDVSVILTPEGYSEKQGTKTVEVVGGEEAVCTFYLAASGTLTIHSQDTEGAALSGMTVVLMESNGTELGQYTSSSDGTIIINDLLKGVYKIKVTESPSDYALQSPEEQEVKIETEADVVFLYAKIYGLQITTICDETGARIPDAEYEIQKMGGKTVGKVRGDGSGIAYIKLEPGWYTVVPLTPPVDYTFANTDPVNIEIKEDELASIDCLVHAIPYIKIQVIDGLTGKGLERVRVQLRDADECIKEYFTDTSGLIKIDSSILSGSFVLEMLDCPEGYILDKVPKDIYTLASETTDVVWALYKEGGQIQVIVTSRDYNETLDKEPGSLLQGAVFEIMNADNYQIMDSIISDATGVASSHSLPVGRYEVKMVSPPPYYALNKDWKDEIRIKVNNDVVRTGVSVKSVVLGGNIEVRSNKSVRAGATMRVDVPTAKNGSDVALDNFFIHIKVPTDTSRIVTLSTGKWNENVQYSISCKTNMNNYRKIAEGLESVNNYQYGLSTQALGLQSGEYVTDVRFEFGTVPANFALTDKMCYTQYILSTAGNGSKSITRIEMGGQYNTVHLGTTHIDNGKVVIDSTTSASDPKPVISGNSGQWAVDTGQWNTDIKTADMPKELPKTGS